MLVIVNFKAFVFGISALKLAKICEKVAKKERANIAVAVQPSDILPIAAHVDIPVLAQHVDAVEPGAHTGWILPESILASGAAGSLFNHSERQLPLPVIKQTINRLRSLGLLSVVCADTPSTALKIAKFKPDVIAIEPPELIGGKVSVSEAKPEVITRTTSAIHDIPVLCGAGVHDKEDVSKAVNLGAMGVLVASGVVLAKNPEKVLTDLVRGFR